MYGWMHACKHYVILYTGMCVCVCVRACVRACVKTITYLCSLIFNLIHLKKLNVQGFLVYVFVRACERLLGGCIKCTLNAI